MKHFMIFSLLGILLFSSFGCAGHHDRKRATIPILLPKGTDAGRQPIIVPEKESKKDKHKWKKHKKNKHKEKYAVCYKGKTKLVKEKNVEKFLRKGAYFGQCR